MSKYGVFESVNMSSTYDGGARIFDAVSTVDIENGTFGYLDGLADGESHIYKFAKGTSAGKFIVVVDNVAWDYDTSKRTNQRLDNYIVPAGTPFRVRVIVETDEFGINSKCVTESTAAILDKGAFLTIDATGKLAAATTSTEDAVFEAEVIRKRTSGATLVTASQNYGHSRIVYEALVTKIV